jgi:L-threonylcarbamoyladenylate synthase
MELLAPTPENLARAAERLRAGGLVGMPTETVYGLAANALDEAAISRVFALKGRPKDHPLIVHLASAAQLGQWSAAADDRAVLLAEALWPGPLTLVVKKAEAVPAAITGGQPTVALRVPAHPVARALLELFGGGLAAPSANRFGRVSPTTAAHVIGEFPDADLLVLDGGASIVGLESTIVDLSGTTPRVLRPGGVTREQLQEILGEAVAIGPGAAAPRVSGSLASHYAPGARVVLVTSSELLATLEGAAAVLAMRPAPAGFAGAWVQLPADPRGYGAGLYAALRQLDAARPARLLIERVPDDPNWLAVRDRLERASAPRPNAVARRSA